jgi:hypothetical protein
VNIRFSFFGLPDIGPAWLLIYIEGIMPQSRTSAGVFKQTILNSPRQPVAIPFPNCPGLPDPVEAIRIKKNQPFHRRRFQKPLSVVEKIVRI